MVDLTLTAADHDTDYGEGGREKVYDENHPAGGTEEYVFDLTTY